MTARSYLVLFPSELTTLDIALIRVHVRNTRHQLSEGKVSRWPGDIKLCLKETPVGIEPTSSCFAGSRLTIWLQRLCFSSMNGRTERHCVR